MVHKFFNTKKSIVSYRYWLWIEYLEANSKSLEISEKIFGKNHVSYYLTLNNLALNYADMGNFKKSIDSDVACDTNGNIRSTSAEQKQAEICTARYCYILALMMPRFTHVYPAEK